MSFIVEGPFISLKAGASVSSGRVVKSTNAGEAIHLAATTDVPLGIACNDAATGEQVRIQISGVAKVITTSAAIAAGGRVQGNATGVGIATATGGYSVGIALEGNGSAAVFIPVALLQHSAVSA